jgi:hypothetical protein
VDPHLSYTTPWDGIDLWARRVDVEWPNEWQERPLNPNGEPMHRYLVRDATGEAVLPELAAARSLDGRYDWWAWYDRWFHHSFRCTMYGSGEPFTPDRWVLEALSQIWVEAGGTLEGMWDAVGMNRDRSAIEFVEAKRAGGRDRLNPNQRRFASAACRTFGERVKFTVVEWEFAPPDRGSAMRRPK